MTRKVFVTISAHTVVNVETDEKDQERVAAEGLKTVKSEVKKAGYFPFLISADVCDEPAKKYYGLGEAMAVYEAPEGQSDEWFQNAIKESIFSRRNDSKESRTGEGRR